MLWLLIKVLKQAPPPPLSRAPREPAPASLDRSMARAGPGSRPPHRTPPASFASRIGKGDLSDIRKARPFGDSEGAACAGRPLRALGRAAPGAVGILPPPGSQREFAGAPALCERAPSAASSVLRPPLAVDSGPAGPSAPSVSSLGPCGPHRPPASLPPSWAASPGSPRARTARCVSTAKRFRRSIVGLSGGIAHKRPRKRRGRLPRVETTRRGSLVASQIVQALSIADYFVFDFHHA